MANTKVVPINIKQMLAPAVVPDEEAAAQRLAMAQAMQQAAQKGNMPEAGGPVQAKYGIGTALADLGTRLASAYNTRQAQQGLTQAKEATQSKAYDQILAAMNAQPNANVQAAQGAADWAHTADASPYGDPMRDASAPAADQAVQGAQAQVAKNQTIANLARALPGGLQALGTTLLSQQVRDDKPVAVGYGSVLVDPSTGRKIYANDRLPGMGGGNSADMQLMDRISKAHPEWDTDTVMEAVRKFKETNTVHDVAGVATIVGNRGGGAKPLTDIGTVASNAGTVETAKAGGKVTGETETQRFYDAPEFKVKVDGAVSKIDEAIKKAEDLKKNPGVSRTTGLLSYFPSIHGGKAADVEAAIESLKTQLGFNELMDMRANSKSGGALGNVSNKEGEWLQNAISNLTTSQSEESFKASLGTIINHMQGVKKRLLDTYESNYGSGAASRSAPTRSSNKVVRYEDMK